MLLRGRPSGWFRQRHFGHLRAVGALQKRRGLWDFSSVGRNFSFSLHSSPFRD